MRGQTAEVKSDPTQTLNCSLDCYLSLLSVVEFPAHDLGYEVFTSDLEPYFLAPTGSLFFRPASEASLSALSVASQVKSASFLPKCP